MKKIIDRNGRLFGLVSIIDVAVVAIVAILAVALYIRSNQLDATNISRTGTTIVFTVHSENQPLYIINALKEGDLIYDSERESGGALGVITELNTSPSTLMTDLGEGEFVMLTDPETRNLDMTVECKNGHVTEDGRFIINKIYELGKNGNRNLTTPYVLFNCLVTSIGTK